jgi:hypothetical protein
MKYGNLSKGTLGIDKELAALKDQLDKELITEEKYLKDIEGLKKYQLAYIVVSNGGFTPPKKAKGRKAQKIAVLREKAAVERVRSYIQAKERTDTSSLAVDEDSTAS